MTLDENNFKVFQRDMSKMFKDIVKEDTKQGYEVLYKEQKHINRQLYLKVNELGMFNKDLLYKLDKYAEDNKNLSQELEELKNNKKDINIKETKKYIELKDINERYNNKISQLESDIEKLQLTSKIEDNDLFIQVKKQNEILLESNNKLDIKVKELNSKIEIISINNRKKDKFLNDIISKNKITDKNETKVNVEHPILENNNKHNKIIKDNINKIINKLDKLYKKDFTDEQITINKSIIGFYSKIYDLIKDKDERNDAQYINEIIDSASTDTNRSRFKKILKVANFINNYTFLERSSIVIPLYMFKIIPINSMDLLFLAITNHFKDHIIDDNSSDSNDNNIDNNN